MRSIRLVNIGLIIGFKIGKKMVKCIKMQSKFSQNAVKMHPKCIQNSVTSWNAYRLKSYSETG